MHCPGHLPAPPTGSLRVSLSRAAASLPGGAPASARSSLGTMMLKHRFHDLQRHRLAQLCVNPLTSRFRDFHREHHLLIRRKLCNLECRLLSLESSLTEAISLNGYLPMLFTQPLDLRISFEIQILICTQTSRVQKIATNCLRDFPKPIPEFRHSQPELIITRDPIGSIK